MAAHKLSKNHWVRPFLVILRFVRDIFLVTVAFDHPVVCSELWERKRKLGLEPEGDRRHLQILDNWVGNTSVDNTSPSLGDILSKAIS